MAPLGESGNLSRARALLLAYKLTVIACRRRETAPRRDLLGELRNVVRAELGSGEGLATGGASRAIEIADSDAAASLIRFEAGLPAPLAPFYGDLAPTFGGPCSGDDLEARFGKMVRHLYDGIQQKLDARDRSARPGTAKAGFAGAGH